MSDIEEVGDLHEDDIAEEHDVATLKRWLNMCEIAEITITAQLEASTVPGASGEDSWRARATGALGWAKRSAKLIQRQLKVLGEHSDGEAFARLQTALNKALERNNLLIEGHIFRNAAKSVLTPEMFASVEQEVARRQDVAYRSSLEAQRG